jgi:hypothetical protein
MKSISTINNARKQVETVEENIYFRFGSERGGLKVINKQIAIVNVGEALMCYYRRNSSRI